MQTTFTESWRSYNHSSTLAALGFQPGRMAGVQNYRVLLEELAPLGGTRAVQPVIDLPEGLRKAIEAWTRHESTAAFIGQ